MGDKSKLMPVIRLVKLVVALGLAILGGSHMFLAGKYLDDNAYEELLEEAVEVGLEETLKMPDGTLDDAIDLTPGDMDGKHR